MASTYLLLREVIRRGYYVTIPRADLVPRAGVGDAIYSDLANPIYRDLTNPIYWDLTNPIYGEGERERECVLID